MPVARNYNGGSIVYFQDDASDEIYVLQKGRVVLLSTSIDTNEEMKEEVQRGEFFEKEYTTSWLVNEPKSRKREGSKAVSHPGYKLSRKGKEGRQGLKG